MKSKASRLCLTMLATWVGGCVPSADKAGSQLAADQIQSAIPVDRLSQVKAALPRVASPALQAILQDPNTFWYDRESMAPSYQESGFTPDRGDGGGGARDNAHWSELVVESLDGRTQLFDEQKAHWRFPLAGTMGIDDSTNVQTADFLSLPRDQSGQVQSIAIAIEFDNGQGAVGHKSWHWIYPNGTVVGEVIFVKDPSGALVATEVRTRQRFASGWATNAFRPFPQASDLSAAIKARRPQYQGNAQLSAVVAQLDGGQLTPKGLHATQLPGVFDQDGSLDVLPDFGDAQLVRELLTQTTFASAYGKVWRQGSGGTAYAASTTASFSVVPNNYTAGLVQVTEDSCMRCHKEAARLVADFYPDLYLYGEIWGKDNIFTFHPFDESYYDKLDLESIDNRHMNPKLKAMGMIRMVDRLPTDGAFSRSN